MGVALQSSLCRTSVQTSIRVNPQFEAASPERHFATTKPKNTGANRELHYAGPILVGCRLVLRNRIARRRYSVRSSIALRPRSDWSQRIASPQPHRPAPWPSSRVTCIFPSAFALAIPSRCLSSIIVRSFSSTAPRT